MPVIVLQPSLTDDVHSRIHFSNWKKSLATAAQSLCRSLDDCGAYSLVSDDPEWQSHPTNIITTTSAARNITTASVVNLAPLCSGSYEVDSGATTAAYIQTPPPEPAPSGFFVARAPGGVRFLTSSSNTGAELPAGATAWAPLSDRNAKTGITAIDQHTVLHKLAALPVTAWNYKHDPKRRYIGPMAQDFHATFGLGSDDKHISTLDTDGVTLSAIKGLVEELRDQDQALEARDRQIDALERAVETMRESIEARSF